MISLYESLLDDFDNLSDAIDHKEAIMLFLTEHYSIRGKIRISKKLNKNDLYEVSCSGDVKFISGKSLTNGMFEWKNIDGMFECDNTDIQSLKGGPKKVNYLFSCANCQNLYSLEGSPIECNDFDCSDTKITTMIGGPKKVKNRIRMNNLKLMSWDGMPKGYKIIEANPNPVKNKI